MGSKASSKDRKDRRKKETVISIVFLAAIVIGLLVAMLYGNGVFDHLTDSGGDRKINMETGEVVTKEQTYDASEISDNANISIPGYEKLEFTAGQKEQSVYLMNPKENTCYFVMSLILEDGTVIWKSQKLEPGMAFNRISLKQALDAGDYENVTLRYDCYSLVDNSELNGSAIKINLEVK